MTYSHFTRFSLAILLAFIGNTLCMVHEDHREVTPSRHGRSYPVVRHRNKDNDPGYFYLINKMHRHANDRISQKNKRLLAARASALPASVDLRSQCPDIIDQGNLGSCTGCASVALCEFVARKLGVPNAPDKLSVLFQYFNSRLVEGDTQDDTGATIANALKAMDVNSVCSDSEWPYDISKFATRPPSRAYTQAKKWGDPDGGSLVEINDGDINSIMAMLASGIPVELGIEVYESFEGDAPSRTGDIPMPNVRRESLLGGHAILIVGYNTSTHKFIFRNSWGTGWGNQGYGTIPFTYLSNANLAGDIWTFTSITVPSDPAPVPTPIPTHVPGALDYGPLRLAAATFGSDVISVTDGVVAALASAIENLTRVQQTVQDAETETSKWVTTSKKKIPQATAGRMSLNYTPLTKVVSDTKDKVKASVDAIITELTTQLTTLGTMKTVTVPRDQEKIASWVTDSETVVPQQ